MQTLQLFALTFFLGETLEHRKVLLSAGQQPGNFPPEIFKDIVEAPVSVLVVRYNKLKSFCLFPQKFLHSL